jgi:hypothetical protein
MILFDDVRHDLAETLQSRVLAVFGRVVDRVDVEIRGDFLRVAQLGVDSHRLIEGMSMPQFIRFATVGSDGAIDFHLDRGAVLVTLLASDGFDSLLLQRIPDDLWRMARAYAEGGITRNELVQYVSASSKRR